MQGALRRYYIFQMGKLRQTKSVTYLKPFFFFLYGVKLIDGVKWKTHDSLFQAHDTFYYLEEILNAVKCSASAVCKCFEFRVLPFLFVPKYTSVIILIWFASIWIKWKKPALVLVSNWLHSFLLADFLSSYVSDGMTWQIPFKLKSLTQLWNILLVHNDVVKHASGGQTWILPKAIVVSSLADETEGWEAEADTLSVWHLSSVVWTEIPSTNLHSVQLLKIALSCI